MFSLALACFAEGESPTPRPNPSCPRRIVFEHFHQVVILDVLRHILDEKDPAIWREATSQGATRYRVSVEPTTLQVTFTSPRGRYVIQVSTDVDHASLGRLIDGHLPRVLVQSNATGSGPGNVISTIGIHPDWLDEDMLTTPVAGARHLEQLRGLVRSAFAADPYLHPQQRSPDTSPDTPFTESAIQQITLQELTQLYRFSMRDDAGRPLRIGLMAPGGIGKTFICARFMRTVFQAERLILVVDNNDILDQAREDYARDFGVRLGDMLTIYDSRSRDNLDRGRNILLINRTMLHRRWAEVVTWMGTSRTGFVFDEAHHLGRGQGAREFQEIFRRFNTDPALLANVRTQAPNRPHYLGLLATATFWHGDTDLIVSPDYLGVRNLNPGQAAYGKIYGPLLYDSERVVYERNFGRNQVRRVDVGTEPEALRHGLATPELARRQLLRAMGLGYLARLSHSDLHDDVIIGPNREEARAFEVIRRIDDQQIRVERTNIAYNLLERAYEHLAGLRTHVRGDVSAAVPPEVIATLASAPNRALILVRRTEVANAVRDALTAIARERGDRTTEVRTVHSGNGSDPREDTLQWFRDRGSYDTAEERATNKFLVVDQLVNEGVDVPKTNAVVILRPFGSAEEGSIRRLIQVITRASRTADYKTHVEIIDFSGASEHLRNILAIATQAYGGGGQSGGGGRTRIEVDIRPGSVAENITRISFINAQPISLSAFATAMDQWLASLAPFDDPRVERSENPSPLGIQILSLIHALPKRAVTANYAILDQEAVRRFSDNRMRTLVRTVGPRLIATHQAMQSLYERYLANGLDRPERSLPQLLQETEILGEIRRHWFEMLEIVRDVDFYRDREVTLSALPHGNQTETADMMARFYARILGLGLPLRQNGDVGDGSGTLQVVGRPRDGAGNRVELIVRGTSAYSYLAGELGVHELHLRGDNGPVTNYVLLRVTPPMDSGDPLWRHITAEHAAIDRAFAQERRGNLRREYGPSVIRRDRELPSLSLNLLRPLADGGTIDLQENEATIRELGRMLRMNHYNYLRSTIQHLVIPPLLNRPR